MFSKNIINTDSIMIIEPSSISSNTNETEVIDEWSIVPKYEIKYSNCDQNLDNNHQQQQQILSNSNLQLLSFNYVYNAFVNSYLTDDFLNQIKNNHSNNHNHNENVIQKLVNSIFGPEKLRKEFRQTRDFIHLLSTKQFDDNSSLHTRILVTIYRKLTGSSVDCPRYGSHWEVIGFQGSDPATDLRGCGLLSLVLTLYLFEDTIINKLTQDIYKLSLHETQNFPFLVMGINLIRILLQIINQNKLNSYFNKSNGKLIDVCGKFYAAFYFELYLQWKNKSKTIKDSGFVLRDIEIKAKKTPKYFLNQLDKYIKNEQDLNKKRISQRFSNVPKIVIQKAESTDQEFSRLDF